MWGNTTLPSHPHPSSQTWSTLFTQLHIHLTSITEAVSDVSLNQGTESSMSIFHVPDPMLDARDAGMKEMWFLPSISSRLRRSQTRAIATVLVLLMGFECPKEWTEKSHSDQNSPTADHLDLCKRFWFPHESSAVYHVSLSALGPRAK